MFLLKQMQVTVVTVIKVSISVRFSTAAVEVVQAQASEVGETELDWEAEFQPAEMDVKEKELEREVAPKRAF